MTRVNGECGTDEPYPDTTRPRLGQAWFGCRAERQILRLLHAASLQFGVLGFAVAEDGDVSVGVFPQAEEILICGACAGGIAAQGAGAPQAEMRQGRQRADVHEAAMVEHFLKLSGGVVALMTGQVRLAARVDGVHAVLGLVGSRDLKEID